MCGGTFLVVFSSSPFLVLLFLFGVCGCYDEREAHSKLLTNEQGNIHGLFKLNAMTAKCVHVEVRLGGLKLCGGGVQQNTFGLHRFKAGSVSLSVE